MGMLEPCNQRLASACGFCFGSGSLAGLGLGFVRSWVGWIELDDWNHLVDSIGVVDLKLLKELG